MTTILNDSETIRETVRQGYGAIAEQEGAGGCCGPASGCCGPSLGSNADIVAAAVGYGEADLEGLPEGANMGLSCGNPVALATLRPGEVVADLGSGGGFDVFIAGKKVGPAGKAIGVDMTPAMLSKARRNVARYRERTGFDNVEFRLGEIEHLPIADNSVDVVISNCVLNLSPDKAQVWREITRILKPGGRVAVSDLALLKPLPEALKTQVEALIGCVAGAVHVEETRAMAEAAGLIGVVLEEKAGYVDALGDWNDPLYKELAAQLPAGAKAGDYVTSLNVSAVKPAAKPCCG